MHEVLPSSIIVCYWLQIQEFFDSIKDVTLTYLDEEGDKILIDSQGESYTYHCTYIYMYVRIYISINTYTHIRVFTEGLGDKHLPPLIGSDICPLANSEEIKPLCHYNYVSPSLSRVLHFFVTVFTCVVMMLCEQPMKRGFCSVRSLVLYCPCVLSSIDTHTFMFMYSSRVHVLYMHF